MANPEHLAILNQGVEVWNQWKRNNPKPDLSDAAIINYRLNDIDFSGTDLQNADLSHSEFINTNFAFADLRGATLTYATFRVASFLGANFSGANLSHSILALTNLSDARLNGTNFSEATLHRTVFGNNDLSEVKGLESVTHLDASTIGIDTIYKSGGNIPEVFLRGCGVPEDFIIYMHSLAGDPFPFYSCFISYTNQDREFARRLYSDLQNVGIRCWFAEENLKIGDQIRTSIDQAIRFHDKLLLVLSEHAIGSEWLKIEVETALKKEREQHRLVLFPLMIDNAIFQARTTSPGWVVDALYERYIADFRDWLDPSKYQKNIARLIRQLKASLATESVIEEQGHEG
jgi:hypothetical protein